MVELYAYAAENLVAEALDNPMTEPELWHFEAETAESTVGGPAPNGWNIWSNGELYAVINVPMNGRYEISARLYATRAGEDLARSSLKVDGSLVESFDIEASSADAMEVITAEVDLQAGLRQISVTFDNDYHVPEQNLDRNLIVDWLRLRGPVGVELVGNPRRELLLDCGEFETGSEACSLVQSFRGCISPPDQRPSGEFWGWWILRSPWETTGCWNRLAMEKVLSSPILSIVWSTARTPANRKLSP